MKSPEQWEREEYHGIKTYMGVLVDYRLLWDERLKGRERIKKLESEIEDLFNER